MNAAVKTGDQGNWYVLVAALVPAKEPLVLAPGLGLRQIPCPITIFDLAEAGAAGFSAWAALEPLCKCCFAEIESAKDADTAPGYDTLNRAWLATALLVLRGFTPLRSIAYSSYSWGNIAGCHKRFAVKIPGRTKPALPQFKGALLDFHFKSIIDTTPRLEAVSNEDAVWIQKHFNRFNQLASESEKFRFALEAAIDWRFAKEPRSAVARIWSGIEALFDINTELVYRISLISACLLTPRGLERKERFDAIKRLYGFRSKVVHGVKLPDEKIFEVVGDSFHLLRDLLLLSVEKGHPLDQKDFDAAVFG
jgi:hypothetical protein